MLIKLDGTINTRDIGNYTNLLGKKIKSGVLFRSDTLANLTQRDLDKIKSLGIEQIIDFNFYNNNNFKKLDGLEYFNIPINLEKKYSKKLKSYISLSNNDKYDIHNFFIDVYEKFILEYQNEFKLFLNILLSGKKTLFFCEYGKDATGYATMLLMKILDIPDKIIFEDYLKSNIYIKPYLNDLIKKNKVFNISCRNHDTFKPLYLVDKRYLNSAFDTADFYYKNIDNYIVNILNINKDVKERLNKYYTI